MGSGYPLFSMGGNNAPSKSPPNGQMEKTLDMYWGWSKVLNKLKFVPPVVIVMSQ